MNWLSTLIAGTLGRWLVGGAAALLLVAGGTAAVQGWRLDHAKADLVASRKGEAAWRFTAGRNRALAIGWATRAGWSEGLRKREGQAAVAAVNASQSMCSREVAEARRSAGAIASLLWKEPRRDPQGCPVRELLDPRELRDTIG